MRSHSLLHHGRRSVGLAGIVALVTVWIASGATTATDQMALTAELDGRPIALADVSDYHCHDRAYPVIRCFGTAFERDRDEGLPEAATKAAMDGDSAEAIAAAMDSYVRWYMDANYGGPSFDVSLSLSLRATCEWAQVVDDERRR